MAHVADLQKVFTQSKAEVRSAFSTGGRTGVFTMADVHGVTVGGPAIVAPPHMVVKLGDLTAKWGDVMREFQLLTDRGEDDPMFWARDTVPPPPRPPPARVTHDNLLAETKDVSAKTTATLLDVQRTVVDSQEVGEHYACAGFQQYARCVRMRACTLRRSA